jgi:formate/nitrite transporter FocA (FNT family)
MWKHVRLGFLAGMLITMGCVAFLKLGGLPGAAVFSAGLWFVLFTGAELFTGRVTSPDYSVGDKLLMLVYNALGALCTGLLVCLSLPGLRETAMDMTQGYLTAPWWALLCRSFMCGVCMYLAVQKLTDKGHLPNVVYGVILFIVSGYAHSIAIAGYAAIALDVNGLWLVPLCAAGNALGSYAVKTLATGRL